MCGQEVPPVFEVTVRPLTIYRVSYTAHINSSQSATISTLALGETRHSRYAGGLAHKLDYELGM